jgi:site-specific recombinase XerD
MHLPEYLTPDQYNKLYHHMPTNMMKDALKVMYVFALRINELCSLVPDDVDFVRNIVMVLGKNGKVRELPITDDILTVLQQAVKRPFKLFNVEVRTFRNYVYQAAAKADIGYCHPHMVRHSRATHLMNAGVQLHDIKAIMRHESITSTLIYTHVALDRMKSIMQANQLAV